MDTAAAVIRSDADRAGDLDLGLLTGALVISATLSILPSPRARALTEGVQTSLLHTALSLLLAISAIVLAVVSLVFGWTRALSLDALSAIVFALVPALFNMPRDLISHTFFWLMMRRRATLRLTLRNFCYVRIGKRCSWIRSPANWPRQFPRVCTDGCAAHFYLRFLPHNLHAREPSQVSNIIATNTHWHGTRVYHTAHCVVLRDFNHGPKAWWFNAIKSATWLVANPALARLDTRNSVLNALSLLADIVIVGDLVLHMRRDFFKNQVYHNLGVKRAVSAAPAFITNHILRQVGLSEWGTISSEVARPNYVYPEGKTEEYALLFFILTEKSNFYATEVPVISNDRPSPVAPPPPNSQNYPGAAEGIPQPDAHATLTGRAVSSAPGPQEGATTAPTPRKPHSCIMICSDGGNMGPAVQETFPMVELAANKARCVKDAEHTGNNTADDMPARSEHEDAVWSKRLGTFVTRNKMQSGLNIIEKLLRADMRTQGDQAIEKEATDWVDGWLKSWGIRGESLANYPDRTARTQRLDYGPVVKVECNVNALRRRRCSIRGADGAEVGTAEIVN